MTSIDPTVLTVKNLIVLDSEGKRIVVSYFSPEWTTVPQQAEYEKSLFSKTSRTNARGEAEIIMFDNLVVVYKTLGDLTFYVTGDENENELVLFSVLHAFYETINLLLRGAVEKKTALENLDQVLVAIDEIVDGGLILETDPQVVASRVSMRSADSPGFDVPFAEQVLPSQREKVLESLEKVLPLPPQENSPSVYQSSFEKHIAIFLL